MPATKPKAPAKTPLVLTFTLEKETKGTHRFSETESATERPAVGTLYVTKEALDAAGLLEVGGLTVTIEGNE